MVEPGPIFVDVEASAAFGGYAISVGFAEVIPAEKAWRSGHKYIRCDQLLSQESRWSTDAEAVHKISLRFLLEHGRPVEEVCEWMNAEFGERTVYLDTGEIGADQTWIDELFAIAGIERRFSFAHVDEAFRDPRVDGSATTFLGASIQAARLAPRTHNAEDDAENWAATWLCCMKVAHK